MFLKVFSVYDSKAKAFLQPFFCVNAAVAVRSFESAVNDQRHDFHRYAGDYTLFEIGEFHESEGRLVGLEAKVSLGVAVEFLKETKSAG